MESERHIEDELFSVNTTKYGYAIRHKASGHTMGLNYTAIPKDASDDYVLGYAKCLALYEGWI